MLNRCELTELFWGSVGIMMIFIIIILPALLTIPLVWWHGYPQEIPGLICLIGFLSKCYGLAPSIMTWTEKS